MMLSASENMAETEEKAGNSSFEETLAEKGYLIYTARGISMMPLIRQRRDIVEIRPLTDRPGKYDVVLYKRRGRFVLHRILRVLPEGYIIAGDHNTFLETDVTDDMILGVLTRIIRNGKTITPDNFWYKAYVHLWCDCYPLRMKILKGKMLIKRILRGVKRRILRLVQKDSSQ